MKMKIITFRQIISFGVSFPASWILTAEEHNTFKHFKPSHMVLQIISVYRDRQCGETRLVEISRSSRIRLWKKEEEFE